MVERLGEMKKERRERIQKGSRERRERDKRELRYHHLSLLVVHLPQGNCSTPPNTCSQPDSAVKHCSSEVLVSTGAAW